MLQSWRAAICAACLALLAAACAGGPASEDEAGGVPGVMDMEVRIGSSLALTGHAGYLGVQTLRGALSYLNHVNESGGIHGRTIRLIAKDDGYDPPRCLVNTQQFLVEENVFALFCYVGTPTTIKILPLVEDAHVPLVGMFTGANALRQPFNRYLVNIRASYYQETGAAVRHLIEDLGARKIAVFYQYDAYGFDGLTGAELALKEYGQAPVARGTYVRGTLAIEEGFERIRESGADAVLMVGTYGPCSKFIKQARDSGFNPYFHILSFVGADELARRLDPDNVSGIIVSQVVPPPEEPDSPTLLWSVQEYIDLLRRYYPEDKPSFVGLEGYLNAKVLVEGLRRAGRQLTREGFIDAIESMRAFPLGEGNVLHFGPGDHQGLDQVYFTSLRDGRFELITDWRKIKAEHDRLEPSAGGGAQPADGAAP